MSKRNKRDVRETKNVSPTAINTDLPNEFRAVAPPRFVRQDRLTHLLQAIFVLFTCFFICVVNRDYLFILQEYNLFLESRTFFTEHFSYVGGPLVYCTKFLTQFFIRPYIGGILLVGCLFLMQLVSSKIFRFQGETVFFSFVSPLVLLYFFTKPGFKIFDDISLASLYGMVVGVFIAFVSVLGYRSIKQPVLRCTYCCLATALLYFFAGVYALLGTVLCMIDELSGGRKMRFRYKIIMLAFMTFTGIIVPLLCFWFRLSKSNLFFAYLAGLPRETSIDRYSLSVGMLLVFGIVLLSAILRPFLMMESSRKKHSQSTPPDGMLSRRFAVYNVVLMVCVCCFVYAFPYSNREFLVAVKMCRMVGDENWKGILDIRHTDPEPVYPIVVFRQLAMFKLDDLADKWFTLPLVPKVEPALAKIPSSRVYGDHVLYEYGMNNIAYRTALTQYFMKETTVGNLKILVLCALVNKEYALASKYLFTMKQSRFHRSWAKKYQDYVEFCTSNEQGNPSPDVVKIKERIAETWKLISPYNDMENSERIGVILLRSFLREHIEQNAREIRKIFLLQVLGVRDVASFRMYFDLWSPEESWGKVIPRHFLEALVMAPTPNEIQARAHKYSIPQELVRDYQRFMESAQPYFKGKQRPKYGSAIQRTFGETYWYFYYFSEKPLNY